MVRKIVLIGSIALVLTSWISFGISTFAPSPAAAEPRCENWDVSQRWEARQGNGFIMIFDLTQTGTKLSGTGHFYNAAFTPQSREFYEKDAIRYPVEGSLTGNSLKLDTGWGGVYIGKIDDTGRIDGTTYDKKDSTSSTTWYSTIRMDCLATANMGKIAESVSDASSQQSKEKPGLKLGRVEQPKALGRVKEQQDPKLEQPDPPICAKARSARARNSPAAPGLEAQCRAAGGRIESQKGLSGAKAPAPKAQQPDPPICVKARSARARNSPAAPGLEAQCRAAGGTP